MGVFIKGVRGLQTIDQVKAHSKYIGFRSQEKEKGDNQQAGFFSKDFDKYADYKSFIKRIKDNPALKHPKSIKAQKLIFSLKDKDYNAYLKSGKDYKDLIRATLKEYEEKHNVKLDWIASVHTIDGNGKSNHPHVHVIIKGVSDIKDKDGRYKRIKFSKNDFKDMKDTFNKEFEKEAQYETFEKYKIDKSINDIGKAFEMVLKEIKRENEKHIAESEFKKQKAIRKEQFKNKEAAKEKGFEH